MKQEIKRYDNLDKAVGFLVKSIDKRFGGSRAFYSKIYNPLAGWSAPYPETTGYIIPTFFEASKIPRYNSLKGIAINMADWIISLQDNDGALPGGLYIPNKKAEKSIFNTAQMIFGLISAWEHTEDKKYLESASLTASWLSDMQEDDGTWSKYHYNKNFFPSYYTRVAWPLLKTGIIINNKKIESAAIKTLDYIAAKVKANGFVRDSGFRAGSYAFLHTIAYTIRGFLESYFLSRKEEYHTIAYNWAYVFLQKYELKKRLAGAYYEDFAEINWYRCLTGEAQLAIIWLKIFDFTNDIRFINAASGLIDNLGMTQPQKDTFFLKSGGLKGSDPYFGKYMSFRQPNWATKFYIDALLLEENVHAKIEQKVNL
jgi:uncharacterized protein YyaL (SSP411 family)